jgi:hypothetical protein
LSGRTLFLMPIHHGLVLLDEKVYPRQVVGMEINKMKNETFTKNNSTSNFHDYKRYGICLKPTA